MQRELGTACLELYPVFHLCFFDELQTQYVLVKPSHSVDIFHVNHCSVEAHVQIVVEVLDETQQLRVRFYACAWKHDALR